MKLKHLQKRKEIYYYVRRIPAHLKHQDSRRRVEISLGTGDLLALPPLWKAQHDAVEAFWRELVANPAAAADGAWRAAVLAARAHGFAYKPMTEIAAGPVAELAERLRALQQLPAPAFAAKAPALLGGVARPALTISAAVDRYFVLVAGELARKSPLDQEKIKQKTRRGIRNFVSCCGDLPVDAIARAHVLAFRNWWGQRLADEELQADTANKDIIELKKVMREIARDLQLEINVKALFDETRFSVVDRQRPSFDVSFVQDKILGAAALAGMNAFARGVVYIVADCGARPKEILFLDLEADVGRDGGVDFIHIRPNKHRQALKTDPSERRIPVTPLMAAGLDLLRSAPARYQDEDSLSAAINKFFAENGMKPTPAHTFYSLRHTFKDRLRDAGAGDSIIDALMGHAEDGPKYGRGHQLAAKLEWMKKIAFSTPAVPAAASSE